MNNMKKKEPLKEIHILLVEDNLGDILLIKEGMKYAEVTGRLSVVRDGEEALQFLRKQDEFSDAVTPDIILLDFNLPRLDGREVLKEIKEDPKLSTIPVVVLTSSEAEKDISQAYQLAANAYVAKPVDYEHYITMLKHINRFWLDTVALPSAANMDLPQDAPEKPERTDPVSYRTREQGEAIHVLVVEDSPGDRLLYRTFLQEDIAQSYQFSEAVNGEEALALCRSSKPDCVLLDHYLPDLDGAEVLEKLIREHPYLPVVMLTGQGSAALAVSLMKKGAQDYLAKETVTPSILQKVVRNAIERGSMLRQIERSNKALVVAKEKAEVATRAKSDFLAHISHELRTPMNVVVGVTHILSSVGPLTGKQRELVDTLQESAENLLELINNLLDLSRTESRGVQLEHKEFDLVGMIEKSLKIMHIKAQEKNLSLSCKIPPDMQRHYVGDSFRIHQVVSNLLSNAIKFTERGEVKVSVSGVGRKGGAADVEIAVADSGIGIAKEQIPLIFRKFTQAESSTFRKYGGSGLGLAICNQLVEAMGGEISVESEEGKGSVFTVRLPLALPAAAPVAQGEGRRMPPKAAARKKSASPPPSVQEPKTILLVEDYQPNVLVATTLLDALGFRCEVAVSGKEALRKLESGMAYAAVLMDVQMSGMDGKETTRRIREQERITNRSRIPVIAMTANAFVGAMQECLDAGMDDYISKPVNPDELKEKIEKRLIAA